MRKRFIPDETPFADLELLSVRKAAMLVHMRPATIRSLMDAWALSRGKMGIPFVWGESRRMIRREALRNYLIDQEKIASYGKPR